MQWQIRPRKDKFVIVLVDDGCVVARPPKVYDTRAEAKQARRQHQSDVS